MEHSAPYPAPVFPAPFSGPPPSWPPVPPPGPGVYGQWPPAPPQGQWHGGGWNLWGSQPGHQRSPHAQQGGPKHYSPGSSMQPGGHGNKGYKNKQKKEPVYTFYCEACDRGFRQQEKYDEHVSQHVKCQEAGCNFRAHEKLVQMHWKTMHGPGAKRIKLDTPEEITKWREERKKNYPTLQNIARKLQLQKEMEARGEVLKTAQFGKMKGMKRDQMGGNLKNKWSRKQRKKQKNVKNTFMENKELIEESVVAENKNVDTPEKNVIPTNKVQTVNPLDVLAGNGAESDSEEEKQNNNLTVIPRQVTSGLSHLISSYGSASDSEPEEFPLKNVAKVLEENCKILAKAPESSLPTQPKAEQPLKTTYVHSQNKALHNKGPSNKVQERNSFNNTRERPNGAKKRHTLLEMLLARDIRHERNVILQCVRYICQADFFERSLDSKQHEENVSLPRNTEDIQLAHTKERLATEQCKMVTVKPPIVSFVRPLEPLDDEIWETNTDCIETFGV